MKYSFRFVCQGGPIEIKAAFLAASLKRNLKCHYEMVACVPAHKEFLQPTPEVMQFLQHIGVKIQEIKNPIGPHYPIGNKLACAAISSTCDYRVFLDSDILCMRPFYGFPVVEPVDLMAKLEDWNHHAYEEWEQLYHFLGLGCPTLNYQSTVLKEPMPLYFNAGVLVINNDSGLPEQWIRAARLVDKHLDIPRKYPNLDQLTLGGIVRKYGYTYSLVGESYNFPAELRPIANGEIPYFCHYHHESMILAEECIAGCVAHLLNDFRKLKNLTAIHTIGSWFLLAGNGPLSIHI